MEYNEAHIILWRKENRKKELKLATSDNLEEIKDFIEKGFATPHFFRKSYRGNSIEVVKYLLTKDRLSSLLFYNYCALGNVKIVKYLIEQGVYDYCFGINAKDTLKSGLCKACINGRKEVVDLLLSYGANDELDCHEKVIDCACRGNNLEVLKAVLPKSKTYSQYCSSCERFRKQSYHNYQTKINYAFFYAYVCTSSGIEIFDYVLTLKPYISGGNIHDIFLSKQIDKILSLVKAGRSFTLRYIDILDEMSAHKLYKALEEERRTIIKRHIKLLKPHIQEEFTKVLNSDLVGVVLQYF